jgi:hypothetical protein
MADQVNLADLRQRGRLGGQGRRGNQIPHLWRRDIASRQAMRATTSVAKFKQQLG